ncbi:MAG: DNA replication/repair protein RecF [Acidimicrobiales bacterium]
MQVERLWLRNFRNYDELELELSPGLITVTGSNGLGKTNLLEAIGYLATMQSFRTAPTDVMIQTTHDHGVVRGIIKREGRELLIECELARSGRGRVMLNRQKLTRRRDLIGTVLVSVFTPDDLDLIKGSPSGRRNVLDDLVVARQRSNDKIRTDMDKVLRQRNALLKGLGGGKRMDEAAGSTLDVWDAKLSELGDRWADLRSETVAALLPELVLSHERLSGSKEAVTCEYRPIWRDGGLAKTLAEARSNDIRRGVTTVGPHRDDLHIGLAGMPSRTHASQGEQRTLALSLRLAAHRHLAELHESSPILLLDDVFSELDPSRCAALVQALPPGQVFVSTAGPLPPETQSDQRLGFVDGLLSAQ